MKVLVNCYMLYRINNKLKNKLRLKEKYKQKIYVNINENKT